MSYMVTPPSSPRESLMLPPPLTRQTRLPNNNLTEPSGIFDRRITMRSMPSRLVFREEEKEEDIYAPRIPKENKPYNKKAGTKRRNKKNKKSRKNKRRRYSRR